MVAYPNQVALPLASFPDSAPHVGVCFGIKDLTSRGGRGACKVALKKNWMKIVSELYISRLVERNHARTETERIPCVYGDHNKDGQRPRDESRLPTCTTAKGS